MARGRKRPCADIAETIERASSPDKPCERQAVFPLVEKEAGLLAFQDIDCVGDARLVEDNGAGGRAQDDLFFQGQPFEVADSRIIPEHDRFGGVDLTERGKDLVLHSVDAGGQGLDHRWPVTRNLRASPQPRRSATTAAPCRSRNAPTAPRVWDIFTSIAATPTNTAASTIRRLPTTRRH